MNLIKIIAAAALTSSVSMGVNAQPMAHIYWPFSLASTHAAMVRTIVEELNRVQSDYRYVFQHRPGAGGSIAANAVLNHQGLALLAGTSSFFIRPNLYPAASHDLSKFSTIISYCTNQPLALVSTKYTNLAEIQNKSINIGVIPGSITHLTAIQYSRSNRIDINPVYYQGTPEMTNDVLGGHLDVAVDFLSSATQFTGKINVLGISGNKEFPNGRTLQSQGIPNVVGTHSNFLIYANDTDPKLIESIRQHLPNVLKSKKLQDDCEREHGSIATKTPSTSEAAALYNDQVIFWRSQSQGLVIEK